MLTWEFMDDLLRVDEAIMNIDIPFIYHSESAGSSARPGGLSGKELLEMFGPRMPAEAVNLLDNSGHKTKAELRCELQAIALRSTVASDIRKPGRD